MIHKLKTIAQLLKTRFTKQFKWPVGPRSIINAQEREKQISTSCKNSNTDDWNIHMLIFIDISNAWSVLKCKQTAMKDESSGHYSTENWNSMLHLRKARKCILEIANHIKYNITKLQTSSFLFAKNPQFSNIPGRKIHKVYIACKPISKANQDLSCGEKSQNKQSLIRKLISVLS